MRTLWLLLGVPLYFRFFFMLLLLFVIFVVGCDWFSLLLLVCLCFDFIRVSFQFILNGNNYWMGQIRKWEWMGQINREIERKHSMIAKISLWCPPAHARSSSYLVNWQERKKRKTEKKVQIQKNLYVAELHGTNLFFFIVIWKFPLFILRWTVLIRTKWKFSLFRKFYLAIRFG